MVTTLTTADRTEHSRRRSWRKLQITPASQLPRRYNLPKSMPTRASTATEHPRRRSLEKLGRRRSKLKRLSMIALLPLALSLAFVSSSEAFSPSPSHGPCVLNNGNSDRVLAQSLRVPIPLRRRIPFVLQLNMIAEDQESQPVSAMVRNGQVFWQDGTPVGSPVSLATLILAVGSISVIGDLLGPQTPPTVEGLAQFSAALSLLMAGIPSFRRPALALIVGASALADVTFSNGNSFPAMLGCLSLATAAYFAGTSSSASTSFLPGSPGTDSTSPPGKELSDTVDLELVTVEHKDQDLEIWSSRFGINVQRDPNPMVWSVEELGQALEEEGLGACAAAMRSAEIDGRVAMGLSKRDEEELRTELGLGLAQRRRLLETLARWREERRETGSEEQSGDEQPEA